MHEGKKINVNFGRLLTMNAHVASTHDGEKQFKSDTCNYSCSQLSSVTNIFKFYVTYLIDF